MYVLLLFSELKDYLSKVLPKSSRSSFEEGVDTIKWDPKIEKINVNVTSPSVITR